MISLMRVANTALSYVTRSFEHSYLIYLIKLMLKLSRTANQSYKCEPTVNDYNHTLSTVAIHHCGIEIA
jgi:hypothetical protein